MTSRKSFDSNAVEVDGIRFETLVPEPVLTVPPKRPNVRTPVRFGIRVTNMQSKSYRFIFFRLMPELQDASGRSLERSYGINATKAPQESDFLLAGPGESLSFFVDAELYWYDYLRLQGWETSGGTWTFHDLKPGVYRVRFTYENQNAVRQIYRGGKIEGLWTGVVSTPFVEFHLIEP